MLALHPPAGAVELAWWPLEEPPFFRTPHMGSAVHARQLKAAHREVTAMISVEMIGYFTDQPGSQRYPVPALGLLYPSTGNFIAVVGDLSEMGTVRRIKGAMRGASVHEVVSFNAPRWIAGVDFSDHLNLWDQGWHAVMVTDTAFNRNPHYHQPTRPAPDA